jgi:hypothetical protein
MDIDETYLQIKEHRYHVYHFNCVSCKRPLERDFKELDGKYYCPDDYAKVRALVCFACGKPITGRSVAALSRAFHPEVVLISIIGIVGIIKTDIIIAFRLLHLRTAL